MNLLSPMKYKPNDRVSLTIHLYAGGFATQICCYSHAEVMINTIEDGLYRMTEDQLNGTIFSWNYGVNKVAFRLVRVVGYHLMPAPEDRFGEFLKVAKDSLGDASEGDGWKKE